MTLEVEAMLQEPETYHNPLLALRDRINRALGESFTCVRCHRELVIPQHLDNVDMAEGKVCMPCAGGS